MGRTLLYSLAGVAIGYLIAFVIALMSSALSTPDGVGIIVLLGSFLAGVGAIAGAIIGGVADLLAFFKSREQARQSQRNRESGFQA